MGTPKAKEFMRPTYVAIVSTLLQACRSFPTQAPSGIDSEGKQ
jgi:hypothetical protein